MKKAQDASPNQQLKQERELRGWSQNDVARQLGVDYYYVSRWERGLTVPSPYYRQKLCTLFGKNANELGLLQHASPQSQTVQDQETVRSAVDEAEDEPKGPAPTSSGGAIQDAALPLLFATSTGLVGRDLQFAQIKARLCSGRQGSVTALSGLPGVGKTTLATALAHNADIQAHFADGVLWAGLGPAPDVPGLLNRWGALLGIPPAQATHLSDSEEWMRALRIVIGTRRLLLLIDDAWRIEAALAFKVGGPNCAYLLTTRFPPLAFQFAPEGTTAVGELTEEEGVTLLAQLAPEVVRAEPEGARLLTRAVGGLPLALTITGNYLRTQAYNNQPRRMRAALLRLQEAQERLLLTQPSALADRSNSLPAGTPVSLQTLIAVSEQQVSEQARSALRALSVFPPKPNSFSEEAAVAVCAVPAEALDELSDAGLLESSEPGRYTLHQVLADYASTHLTDHEVSRQAVLYFTSYVVEHSNQYELLEQESNNIIAALRLTSSGEEHTAAQVRCIAAFAPFLVTRGLYTQAVEFLQQAEQAIRSLEGHPGLSVVLYQLGLIQIDRGDWPEAEASLREGLSLARQEANGERICQCLNLLGVITRFRGNYKQATEYYQEGLALARQIQNQEESRELLIALLMGLGTTACEEGDYDRAETCLREGEALVRQTADRAKLCSLLVNSGQVAIYRGDYEQADGYALEALQIARQIGYLLVVATALGNLGAMATEQGRYAEAETYQQEALQLARQLENPVSICMSLGNLGDIALRQGHDDQAEEYLRDSLALARQIGRHVLLCEVLDLWGELQIRRQQVDQAEAAFREIRALATEGTLAYDAAGCYGLARVALARERHEEARIFGQESVRIFESIGNSRKAEVEVWLHGAFS